jgi:glyoxylase-like metal-dependent hydrolase (beta-lactamase superfamily II)/rhodanese-related sulfurtransferase
MFFRQLLHEDLGCASYVVADGGRAAVIDPKWEIEDYLRLADEHDLRIEHVLETHNHADHLSGHGRLAETTGATLHISPEADAEYPHEPLDDQDTLDLGDARITALATPGHRPEHTSFLIEDRGRAKTPWLVLTGDSLFVGDIARPDLAIEPEEGARGLFRATKRLLELDDVTELWPGHVGGSLCGGAGMSEKPVSTIGFERRHNELLGLDEDEFVRRLTSELAPQPPNFERIVELNRGALVTVAGHVEPVAPNRALELLGGGATLVDGRDPREYDAAHVPDSLNVTMIQSGVGTRAAWVLELDSDIVGLAASDEDARRLARLLEAIGFSRVAGYVAGGIGAWRAAKLETRATPALDVKGLAERLWDEEAVLLDVREQDEWERGHVEGSIHVPYRELANGLPNELREAAKPLAVACSVGNRSSLAASLLRRAGIDDVLHVADGGVADLAEEGFALVGGTRS